MFLFDLPQELQDRYFAENKNRMDFGLDFQRNPNTAQFEKLRNGSENPNVQKLWPEGAEDESSMEAPTAPIKKK
jgi:hypothetical protein